MYSKEHLVFLKKEKRARVLVIINQILILLFLLIIWEVLSRVGVINTFLFSSPSNIIKTISNLYKSSDLFNHICITTYETALSFIIASILGIGIATILWWNKFISRVIDPYLTVLNSLPKVALGPLIIVWIGAKVNSIIIMALMISVITCIINIYNGFINTDKNYIKLLKSMNASKLQIFLKIVFPSNIGNIINTSKINISLSFIGVIMGELLVSKRGLGYLIMYGSQVFNINLVISSIFMLGILSYIMYYIVYYIEKRTTKNK